MEEWRGECVEEWRDEGTFLSSELSKSERMDKFPFCKKEKKKKRSKTSVEQTSGAVHMDYAQVVTGLKTKVILELLHGHNYHLPR